MSKRLEILEGSLAKKTALLDQKLQAHMDDVRSTNGQPLNDKRNGGKTLGRWDRQNDSLRTLNESIEATRAAIEREETKIAMVEMVELPDPIKTLIKAGTITQWRKHPRFFFVNGVDKARIVLLDNGTIAHRYLSSITCKEKYAIFRDVFNPLNRALASAKESA